MVGEKVPSRTELVERQLLIEGGLVHQARLFASVVCVVGVGGLGCPAVQALCGAGVEQLLLVDNDRVEASNLHRQTLHNLNTVGDFKVDSAAQACAAINPHVIVERFPQRLTVDLAETLFPRSTVILDCVDNLETRLLISDVATRCRKPVVSGAALGVKGQLLIYGYPFLHSGLSSPLSAPGSPEKEGTMSRGTVEVVGTYRNLLSEARRDGGRTALKTLFEAIATISTSADLSQPVVEKADEKVGDDERVNFKTESAIEALFKTMEREDARAMLESLGVPNFPQSCANSGVFGPVCAFIGVFMANITCRLLTHYLKPDGGEVPHHHRALDSAVRLPKNFYTFDYQDLAQPVKAFNLVPKKVVEMGRELAGKQAEYKSQCPSTIVPNLPAEWNIDWRDLERKGQICEGDQQRESLEKRFTLLDVRDANISAARPLPPSAIGRLGNSVDGPGFALPLDALLVGLKRFVPCPGGGAERSGGGDEDVENERCESRGANGRGYAELEQEEKIILRLSSSPRIAVFCNRGIASRLAVIALRLFAVAHNLPVIVVNVVGGFGALPPTLPSPPLPNL